MAEVIPIAELQMVIIVAALVVGAIRGGIGYVLTAPENENFNFQKLGKTMARYALLNFVGINLAAYYTGVVWTPIGVVVITLMQLAADMGFDITKKV